ncbi:MAG: hypothetical protein HY000_01315 [Planctomycetes bacterium]|nr:hypothetical protein [Planctomycetota bacterium]
MVVEVQQRAYDEIVAFLAGGPKPEEILSFQPSAETQERVRDLLERNRSGTLAEEEEAELDQYGHAEHLMRLLKAHVRRRLDLP